MASPITWRNVGSSVNPNAVARSGAYANNALNQALGGIQNTLTGIGQKKKDDALESFKNSLAGMNTDQLGNVDLAGLSESTGLGASQLQEMVNGRIQTGRNQQIQDSKFAEFERGKIENPIIDGIKSQILGMDNRKDIDNFLQQSIEANPNLSEQAKAQIMSFGSLGDKVFNQNRQEEAFKADKIKNQKAQEKSRIAGIQDANMNNFVDLLANDGISQLSYGVRDGAGIGNSSEYLQEMQKTKEYQSLTGAQKLKADALILDRYKLQTQPTPKEIAKSEAAKGEIKAERDQLKEYRKSIKQPKFGKSLSDANTLKQAGAYIKEVALARGNEDFDGTMNSDVLAGPELVKFSERLGSEGLTAKYLKELGVDDKLGDGFNGNIPAEEITLDVLKNAIAQTHEYGSDQMFPWAVDTGAQKVDLIKAIYAEVGRNREKRDKYQNHLENYNQANKVLSSGQRLGEEALNRLTQYN